MSKSFLIIKNGDVKNLVRNYIGGKKVEQDIDERFKELFAGIDMGTPEVSAGIMTVNVPILRTNGFARRIMHETFEDGLVNEITNVFNQVLRSFLEANQDKILLDTIHFECHEDIPTDSFEIGIRSMRAISVEQGEYMDHVRSYRRNAPNYIVFPRLIYNENR
jgi:hypothetical protein